MHELLSVCLLFLKLSMFTFGGGLTIIPLMQQELSARGYMTLAESVDIIAIAEMTPGPFAVNAATFVGMRLFGVSGAALATLSMVLPSIILGLIAARFFFQFRDSRIMQGALYGVRPAVVAMICATVIHTGATILFPGGLPAAVSTLGTALDWPVLVIAVAGLAVLLLTKLNPIYVILASAVVGAVFLH